MSSHFYRLENFRRQLEFTDSYSRFVGERPAGIWRWLRQPAPAHLSYSAGYERVPGWHHRNRHTARLGLADIIGRFAGLSFCIPNTADGRDHAHGRNGIRIRRDYQLLAATADRIYRDTKPFQRGCQYISAPRACEPFPVRR